MKHYQRIMARAGSAIAGFMAPVAVLAATNPFKQAQSDLGNIQGATGVGATDLPTLVGRIINAVLGILGLLLLIYLLYGGFLWMTSGGDSKGVEKAQTMIRNAIVGLVVIM
ncbi:MAG: hypothetical protein Q8R07_01000, partial [Candidatus Uhrbacteria bacterium]|nr:hypothetical protein [Candidatus Uhrbacteria bacterium]